MHADIGHGVPEEEAHIPDAGRHMSGRMELMSAPVFRGMSSRGQGADLSVHKGCRAVTNS
jgi:hypothetical protein